MLNKFVIKDGTDGGLFITAREIKVSSTNVVISLSFVNRDFRACILCTYFQGYFINENNGLISLAL